MYYYRLKLMDIYPSAYNLAMVQKIEGNDRKSQLSYVRVDSYESSQPGTTIFNESPTNRWQTNRGAAFPHYIIFTSTQWLHKISITFGDSVQYVVKNFDIAVSHEDLSYTHESWRVVFTGVASLSPLSVQTFYIKYPNSLIKSNNRYYTYKNNEFIEVEPTLENFKENNIYLPQLITPTTKEVLTMEGGEVLEDGKIYRKTIDISKYGSIDLLKINNIKLL